MFTSTPVADQETVEGVFEVVGDACIKVVVGVFAGGFCRDPREVFGDAPDVRVDWEFRSSKAYRVSVIRLAS